MNDNEESKASIVWWIILIVCLSLLFFSCTRKIYVPVTEKVVETVTVRDTTVQVHIEHIRDSVNIPDTVSFLENKYAVSYARWQNKMLSHSLSTKNLDIPVKIQYIDKEIIKEVPTPYPVEKIVKVEKKLAWYDSFCLYLGRIAMIILVITGVYLIIKYKK